MAATLPCDNGAAMQPDLEAIVPARVEWRGATPAAAAFDDIYFSTDDPRAESLGVFVAGNRLEQRFAGLVPGEMFVVGETGFGAGLNLLLTAEAFSRHAPVTSTLAMLSSELHPLRPEDLERALAPWPQLGVWRDRLLEAYPPLTPGFHRLRLADNIELTLMFGDALAMLKRQPAGVDAWFLDGFAPAKNPAMWTPALCRLVAQRSRPGATLATFSVAGALRTALADAGFELWRRPGFGRKRHRLEGRRPGPWAPARVRRGTALVIGAGLAGATSARALAERGWRVRVLDAAGVAAGGSGNRAGVVYTTPSGAATPQNRFYQSGYLHALAWLRTHRAEDRGIGAFGGVIQLGVDARRRRRLGNALGSGHWPGSELVRLDGDSVLLRRAGWLRPGAWCRLLLDHPGIEWARDRLVGMVAGREAAVELAAAGVQAADAVVLCTAGNVPGIAAWPIRRIRGQVTELGATAASRAWQRPVCHEGYLTPAIDGVHLAGATFDPGDADPAPRPADDAANLAQMARYLPDHWRALGADVARVVGRRVAFRCQSRDFVPIAGPVHDSANESPDVWASLAHGSRGITGTPLAAMLIADRIAGLPVAVDSAIAQALAPARFRTRREVPRTSR